jgi:hypothetical protein
MPWVSTLLLVPPFMVKENSDDGRPGKTIQSGF